MEKAKCDTRGSEKVGVLVVESWSGKKGGGGETDRYAKRKGLRLVGQKKTGERRGEMRKPTMG